jgi:hypothetical protein
LINRLIKPIQKDNWTQLYACRLADAQSNFFRQHAPAGRLILFDLGGFVISWAKTNLRLALLVSIATIPVLTTFGANNDELFPPSEYIHSKLRQNDILFLGTTHKEPKILGLIAELIPSLKKTGVSHVGLEIASDHQQEINAFMRTGKGFEDIKLHSQIACPEYLHLFQVLRKSGGPLPVAIDLPYSKHDGGVSRNDWMARSLLAFFNANPKAKILVIVGNHHILKKLEWEQHVPDKKQSVREYLKGKKPSIKMWSVGQLIDENPNECDFTQKLSALPDAVALDLDDRYRGWKLGLTASIAISPSECFELVDGLVIY